MESAGLAWTRLAYCSAFLLFGTAVLYKFFKNREVLEIRSRSAYLVTVLGLCLLVDFAIEVHVECQHLFNWPSNIFATHLAYFFTVFTIESCYISRVIRLGVSFSPRIRKAIPWIMSEKLLVIASITFGLLSMIIPAYYYTMTQGNDFLVRFVLIELEVVWKCQLALVGIQLCLIPVVWMVDDIFRISWELSIIIMLGVIDLVVIGLADSSVMSAGVRDYINSYNIAVLWTSLLFGLSVVDPVRRLAFHPVAQVVIISRRDDDPYHDHIPRRRKTLDLSALMEPHARSNDTSEDGRDDPNGPMTVSTAVMASTMRTKWSYDKMASVPAVAEAFRAFASRALCQESILFLEEVSKYESGDYAVAQPGMNEFVAFNLIIKRFVADGSPEEINISSRDKHKLIDIFKAGPVIFFSLDDEERRLIFGDAFLEIRSMLEINLLHRFLHTDGFRRVQTETPNTEVMEAGFNSAGER